MRRKEGECGDAVVGDEGTKSEDEANLVATGDLTGGHDDDR